MNIILEYQIWLLFTLLLSLLLTCYLIHFIKLSKRYKSSSDFYESRFSYYYEKYKKLEDIFKS